MKTIAVILAASVLAMPAFAGGPTTPEYEPEVAPMPAPVMSSSADWSGFYAGAQLGFADVGSNGGGLDGDGMLGGVHAGYRWDLGNTVLGVEGDFDTADIELGGGAGSLDSVSRLKLIGGADLGRTLIYATGGMAWAKATVGAADLSDNGYFLGAGMDYALTDRWSVGGEVLGHKFDDFDGSGVDLDATTVKAKVSFSF
ncbi:outer membrane beta-barrel protein [Rhodobacter sp. Har01]|uniref:outer membrane protein n=1 Tax=Rhodobacter sp. Har01 TaxID=2883999 RepID=UPI001D083DCC|nr:outer membrane beta-barrel protein [Rhodobacter sp. Har01]MCB6177012.1 outer membrane beta-barrel protein [Rhodobacter sp. Har01]